LIEQKLKESTDLHDLQLKERNLLLVELTDQLTVARKKIAKEQKIREHIVKHDAGYRQLERQTDRVPAARRQLSMGVWRVDPPEPETDAPALAGLTDVGDMSLMSPGRARPATAGARRNVLMAHSHSQSQAYSQPQVYSQSYSQAFLPDRPSSSPDGGLRRPSTSGGNAISYSANLRSELHRCYRDGVVGEPLEASTSNQYDSHMGARQSRVVDDAGHRAVIMTREDEHDIDKVIGVINSDPSAKLSDSKMQELKNVRAHIVTMLAHKVTERKKPTGRPATAKAADDGRKGRAFTLKKLM
jgi:hypothetical protein